MPLTRVAMRRGKDAAYKRAILDGLYQAMHETFKVPTGDRFMTIDEYDADDFDYGKEYLGIARSDDLVIVQLTVSDTRDVRQKQELYKRIVTLLGEKPGLRPEDVMIVLTEVKPENWSFGLGDAQYVK